MSNEPVDPWPPAQEGLFNIVRAWAREEDPEKVAQECLDIMKNLNTVEGAPFIFVCELARMFAEVVAKYMSALNEELPTREQLLAELDTLEMEYIEDNVLAEFEDENDTSDSG